MITKFFKITGWTEHFIVVRRWRSAYRRWNEFQGWLSVTTNNRIQPVWIMDKERFLIFSAGGENKS